MLRQGLKKTISKFKETGELNMLQGRVRKWISNDTDEEVAFVVTARSSVSQYSSVSALYVSRDLYLL